MSAATQTVPPTVFLSYSRRDFAFAEALAATLSVEGRTLAWLDVAELAPGSDWSATIEQAIDAATVLLLIASPAALASPYVTEEWARAREQGKTIHICVVEAVDLPTELAECPVHDLRGRFWDRAAKVREVIAAGKTTSVAPLGRLRLVPPPVAALLATSLVITVALLWASAENLHVYRVLHEGKRSTDPLVAGYSLMEVFAFLGMGLTMLVVAALVPWRRSTGATVSYNFAFAAIAGYTLLRFSPVGPVGHPELDGSFGTEQVLGAVLMAAALVGGGLMIRSRTVYLWLPTGEGYYQVRQRILGRPVTRRRRNRIVNPRFEHLWAPYAKKLSTVEQRATFEVRCDEGDEQIARLIRTACLDAGLTETATSATWVLRLVSSKTDYAAVGQELDPRAICVLVDNLRLPEAGEELRRRQWLDFREQMPEGLYNLVLVLRGAQDTSPDTNPVPVDTTRFRSPLATRTFVELSRTYLVVIAAFPLGLLILRPFQFGVVALAAVSVVPLAYLWRLLRNTTTRLITGRAFRIRCAVLVLIVLLWSGYLGAVSPWLLLYGVLVVMGLIVGMVRVLRLVPRYWLPTKVTRTKSAAIMPRLFTSYLAPVAAVTLGMAAMVTELLQTSTH